MKFARKRRKEKAWLAEGTAYAKIQDGPSVFSDWRVLAVAAGVWAECGGRERWMTLCNALNATPRSLNSFGMVSKAVRNLRNWRPAGRQDRIL